MTVAIQQELPSPQVGVRLTAPGGYSNRLAEDEPFPYNVISDIEIMTEMPGGYKELNFTLGRDPQKTWLDLVPYTDVKAYMPGVGLIFEGSLDKGPGDSGEQKSLSPSFLGYQSILEDNQAVQIGIIDTDLSRFGEMSTGRRLGLRNIGWNMQVQVVVGFQDTSAEAAGILFDYTGVETPGGHVVGNEAWYYGDGADVGAAMYDFKGDNTGTSSDFVGISKDDMTTKYDSGPNHNTVSALQQLVKATESGRKYVFIQMGYTGAFVGQMTNLFAWLNFKILGTHGMTPVGNWPNIGFTVKQMLEYLIPKIANPLVVDPNYIDDDNYVITQAWYGEPTSATEVIKDILKYGLYDWFVYHGKRFELRRPGSYGKYWKAYTAPSSLNEVGIDSQRLWRSIIVSYQDVDGSTRTVGPIGSGCNIESSQLEINDPSHPAVQAGRTRRDILDLQGIAVETTAVAVGQRFLEEANLINRSGSATLQGYVMDQYGVMWPVAAVKSGDWISFVDSADVGYRKIIGTTYRHNEVSNEIDLDAPESGLEALLERLQAGLLSLGVN